MYEIIVYFINKYLCASSLSQNCIHCVFLLQGFYLVKNIKLDEYIEIRTESCINYVSSPHAVEVNLCQGKSYKIRLTCTFEELGPDFFGNPLLPIPKSEKKLDDFGADT